ncbi:pyridoxal phosphate-dependent aminotransferase [Vibrio viridaestus]|uniref:Aminotransferase class I/II-fold pyridoxal phosphate-dependent enzyme n=1 Tax=Vibrio viridaestus TaxID=2487322 RepID=A0A3N9TDR3_9VIBR|nr:pyridoxal phosphate-dependent aminotransferase [Vibrio viridaestus]RQW62357.1 aminotransferase class I/II-fold pyridoxal phosphate-dependent enzyme [Vibrio viridaestus]
MMLSAHDDISPIAQTLSESSIRTIANFGMTQQDVIPLWFGESDIVTPEFIRQAAFDSLNQGQTLYTPNNGMPALRRALADYQSHLFNNTFDEDNIVVTVSGTNAVMLAAQTVLKPKDKVVVITPAFPTLMAIPRLLNAEVIEFPLTQKDGRFELDIEQLKIAAKDARALIINSPNNPTGWMADDQQIRDLVKLSRKTGLWILSDEVYSRHVYEGLAAPSFAEYLEESDRIIICNSFSKAWCMTGWRLGWLTLPHALRPTITKLIEFNVSCAPAFVQAAGYAAITQGDQFLHLTLERFRQSRDMVKTSLSGIDGVTLYDMPATFYAFLKVEGLPENSEPFILDMIKQAKVGVAPGEAFGQAGSGHLRLCYGASHDKLAIALERLRAFLLR